MGFHIAVQGRHDRRLATATGVVARGRRPCPCQFMLNGDFARHLKRMHKRYAAGARGALRICKTGLTRWFTPIAPDHQHPRCRASEGAAGRTGGDRRGPRRVDCTVRSHTISIARPAATGLHLRLPRHRSGPDRCRLDDARATAARSHMPFDATASATQKVMDRYRQNVMRRLLTRKTSVKMCRVVCDTQQIAYQRIKDSRETR
jgi:hypothetical protein